MAFTKVFPGGVPANATFTAAELSTLDTDHANALDKTGDTTAGDITIGNTFKLKIASGAYLQVLSGGTNQVDTGGVWNVKGTQNIGDGLNPATFRVKAGATLQIDGGATASCATTFLITGAGAFAKTVAGGRFKLGDNDYPVFGAAHPGLAPVRRFPLAMLAGNAAAGWSPAASGLGMTGSGTSAISRFALPLGPIVWHGQQITQLSLLFTPAVGPRGAWPIANNITATLKYFTPNVGGVAVALGTIGSTATYAPVSQADYENGLIKKLVWTADSPTIDVAANCYLLEVIDENGANAISGNVFHALEVTYSAPDLRPQ
jgi:hypothetical protein